MTARGLTICFVVLFSLVVLVAAWQSSVNAAAPFLWQGAPDEDREGEPGRLAKEPWDRRAADLEDREQGRRPGRLGPGLREDRRGRTGPDDAAWADPADPETIGRVMEILRARLPEVHERLEILRRENPVRFERAIRVVMPVVGEYVRLRDRNPELAETIIEEFRNEERLRELSRVYREAEDNPEERAGVLEEIERLVREQLELRFRRQTFRLEEFERRLRRQEERLERHRARLQEEMEHREELVAERIEDVKQGKVGDQARRPGPRRGGPDDRFRGRGHRGRRDDMGMTPGPWDEPPPGPGGSEDAPPPRDGG